MSGTSVHLCVRMNITWNNYLHAWDFSVGQHLRSEACGSLVITTGERGGSHGTGAGLAARRGSLGRETAEGQCAPVQSAEPSWERVAGHTSGLPAAAGLALRARAAHTPGRAVCDEPPQGRPRGRAQPGGGPRPRGLRCPGQVS